MEIHILQLVLTIITVCFVSIMCYNKGKKEGIKTGRQEVLKEETIRIEKRKQADIEYHKVIFENIPQLKDM